MIALVAGCFVVAVFHDGAAHYQQLFSPVLLYFLIIDEVIGVCVCVRARVLLV